jgi:hypothetical protein
METDTFEVALAELDAAERGCLLAVALGVGGQAEAVLAALDGPAGARVVRAWQVLLGEGQAARARQVAKLAAEALQVLPAGLADVHPDWLSLILEAEPPAIVALVAAGANAPPSLRALAEQLLESSGGVAGEGAVADVPAPVAAEVRRGVLAPIVAVPALPEGVRPARWARRLLALSGPALLDELRAAAAGALQAETATAARPAWSGAASGETRDRAGARAVGARMADDDEEDLALAAAQRLPLALGQELLAAARPRKKPAAA